MASRWAFEALAVRQFKENDFEKMFYQSKKQMSEANFRKNFWIPNLKAKIGRVEANLNQKENAEQLASDLLLLTNEINKELLATPHVKFEYANDLTPEKISEDVIKKTNNYLDQINKYYIKVYNRANEEKDNLIRAMQETPEQKEAFIALKNNCENNALNDLVTNKNDLKYILEVDNQLIQRTDPVYLDPSGFRAHFYAPRKKIFGNYVDTFWANIAVLWLMSIMLIIMLYFDVFKRLLGGMEAVFTKLTRK